MNDSLSFSFDAHHSSAEVDGGELNNSITFTTDNKAIITHLNGGSSGIQSFSYDTDFGPENFMATGATTRDGYKENVMDQFQVNGEWVNNGGGLLSSIQFGLSRVESDFQKIRNIGNFGADFPSPESWDDALFNRTNLGSFMNSFDPLIGTDYYYRINPADAMAAFIANNPDATDPVDGNVCCGPGGIDDNERVNETLDSVLDEHI